MKYREKCKASTISNIYLWPVVQSIVSLIMLFRRNNDNMLSI